MQRIQYSRLTFFCLPTLAPQTPLGALNLDTKSNSKLRNAKSVDSNFFPKICCSIVLIFTTTYYITYNLVG